MLSKRQRPFSFLSIGASVETCSGRISFPATRINADARFRVAGASSGFMLAASRRNDVVMMLCEVAHQPRIGAEIIEILAINDTERLPSGSAIELMLADDQVVRGQADYTGVIQ